MCVEIQNASRMLESAQKRTHAWFHTKLHTEWPSIRLDRRPYDQAGAINPPALARGQSAPRASTPGADRCNFRVGENCVTHAASHSEAASFIQAVIARCATVNTALRNSLSKRTVCPQSRPQRAHTERALESQKRGWPTEAAPSFRSWETPAVSTSQLFRRAKCSGGKLLVPSRAVVPTGSFPNGNLSGLGSKAGCAPRG